ncbi:GL16912 [Drosophila persimilis]|uniref:GL16912 n=1 Tax=Drosophila persimilis TaxID=7234 RepID=B4GHN4_DROPE|nr:uncharacterized protein LOC6592617 [Drosophila persimilis]EDW36004.1 GL16912 [Drosophila persimilis]
MEKFWTEVEQSQTLSQEETETTATIPFETTDISGISLDAPSGLHIATDIHLEKKLEPVRVVAGQDRSENIGNGYISVARRRGLPQLNLEQTESYIFELPTSSNQSLEPEVAEAKDTNMPTIQVNPPIPQNPELETVAPESLDSSLLTVSQPRLSSIKDRILLFERTCLPPSVSTEPATSVWLGADTQENSATTPLTPSINMVELNFDRIGAGCCTVEPSQVLVEHMQPKADVAVEAHSGCHQQPARQQMEAAQRLEQTNSTLDQEIDLMIERALNEVNKMAVAPNEVDKLRNYLQANKNRFNKLVQYQYDESLRMQAEFDRQQKFLIKQICAEIELPFAPLSEHTSTRSLQQQADEPISNSMATTSGADSPYLVPIADSYIPSHPLLKCFFGTGQGVPKSSEHESKSLSGTVRKSDLNNSKRPAARSASTAQKSNNCRTPGPVFKGVAFQRVVGGGGGSVGSEDPKKTSLGRGNGTATRSRSTARRPPQGQQQQQRGASKARKTSTPMRGRNVSSHK